MSTSSSEEWGESLLSDLLNNIIDSGAVETQLHPTHQDKSINAIPGIGEVNGIMIPPPHYPYLIKALKDKLGFGPTDPTKRFLLSDFRMKVRDTLHLFIVEIDPVPSGGEKVRITRK